MLLYMGHNKMVLASISFLYFEFLKPFLNSQRDSIQNLLFLQVWRGWTQVMQAAPFPSSNCCSKRFPALCSTFGQNLYADTLMFQNTSIQSKVWVHPAHPSDELPQSPLPSAPKSSIAWGQGRAQAIAKSAVVVVFFWFFFPLICSSLYENEASFEVCW